MQTSNLKGETVLVKFTVKTVQRSAQQLNRYCSTGCMIGRMIRIDELLRRALCRNAKWSTFRLAGRLLAEESLAAKT